MAITGSSTTDAPSPVRRSTSDEAWARVRVTTIVTPASRLEAGQSVTSARHRQGWRPWI